MVFLCVACLNYTQKHLPCNCPEESIFCQQRIDGAGGGSAPKGASDMPHFWHIGTGASKQPCPNGSLIKFLTYRQGRRQAEIRVSGL